MMRRETRNLIIERYTGWAEQWCLSLAFAVTQSVEKAESITADAIVALIAAASEEESNRLIEARAARFRRDRGAEITESPAPLPPPRPGEVIVGVSSQRFAAVVWEMSSAQAYRGFGADPFFRMPAVARAIVILKIRAQFSCNQIAGIVRLTRAQVEDHLENARLLFSEGRPWVEAGPGMLVQGASWAPECPQWNAGSDRREAAPTENIQDVFAQYIGNDLDTETGSRLHSHLVVCNSCRTSFAYFKRQYSDWIASVPAIDTAPEMRKHLSKITNQALKARRRRPVFDAPSAWPGIFRVIGDGQVRAMIYGAGLVMFGQVFLHKHPLVIQTFKRMLHFR